MKRILSWNTLVMALLVLALVGLPTGHASAGGSLVVTSVNEGSDATPGDGLCDTGTGSCTLRAAMEEANALPGADTISFSLPGSGIHSISITSGPLPPITDTLTLDGTSQPTCTVPCIVLSGAGLAGSNSGLVLNVDNNVIKGFIITSWSFDGIAVNSNANTIQSNDIGFWPGDPAALPNGYGVELQGSGNLIGGLGVASMNIISGNTYNGIAIARSGGTATGNMIQGNYIGTNETGTAAIPNGQSGIAIFPSASSTMIGGTLLGSRNVISGNAWRGIDSAAPGTRVQGNFIGTNAGGGNGSMGNGLGGLLFSGSVAMVGGGAASATNVIAYNHGNGITVVGASTRVNMRRNSIHMNSGLGIDLGNNGVSLNDLLDPDLGPNGYQNFPSLGTAVSSTHIVEVTLRSKANQTYRIDLYVSPAGTCDPSHYGEGRRWIGTATVTTNANGFWSSGVTTLLPFVTGQVITGTATDSIGNTSEFSLCRVAS